MASLAMGFTGSLSTVFSPKWIILIGLSMAAVATALLAVGGSRPEDYWSYIFPAFILGSAGVMLTYTHTKQVGLVMLTASRLMIMVSQHRYLSGHATVHGRYGWRDL